LGDEEKPMVKKPHTNRSEIGLSSLGDLSSLGVELVSTSGSDSPQVDTLGFTIA
jgi:hypothetical protein